MKKTKIIFSVVMTILVLAIAVGLLASLSSGFKDWNVKGWFGGEAEEDGYDVEFNLEFKDKDEETGLYIAKLSKEQQAALLDYASPYFVGTLTGEYMGEETKVDIPLYFFAAHEPGTFNYCIGFSDTGTTESNVGFILPITSSSTASEFDTGKLYAFSVAPCKLSFKLHIDEENPSLGRELIDVWETKTTSKTDNTETKTDNAESNTEVNDVNKA